MMRIAEIDIRSIDGKAIHVDIPEWKQPVVASDPVCHRGREFAT